MRPSAGSLAFAFYPISEVRSLEHDPNRRQSLPVYLGEVELPAAHVQAAEKFSLNRSIRPWLSTYPEELVFSASDGPVSHSMTAYSRRRSNPWIPSKTNPQAVERNTAAYCVYDLGNASRTLKIPLSSFALTSLHYDLVCHLVNLTLLAR